jgi:anion-transporting  ArsA/GET3 family ATPase
LTISTTRIHFVFANASIPSKFQNSSSFKIMEPEAGLAYLSSRRRAQQSCTARLTASLKPGVELSQVPYVDTEVRGVYGLRYFAQLAHAPAPKSATNPMNSKKLTVFGGKGGVGKTSSAAAWAVQLADSGLRTLVVSSDPAHSLGDALNEPLGGTPRQIDLGMGGGGGTDGFGMLWAMEIDPEAGLREFQSLLDGATKGEKAQGMAGMAASMGLPDITAELGELVQSFDSPPPGTDEVRILRFCSRCLLLFLLSFRFFASSSASFSIDSVHYTIILARLWR